ncbi:PREDICTED: kelch-like protein 41b [Rhagoletis zephyria]|uniref:kelch-like protein 41b n=1 Tax=Rhagoletis zephyria TaxID=28612 RepID=UPI0008113DAC|nr:PREDICTED: kelch-like protein 41b [Rhagoletis zephyria]
MFQCVLGDLSRLLDGNSPLQTDFTIITTKSLVKSSASGGHYQLERRIQRHQAHRFVLSFRSRYFESYFRFEANQGKDKGKEKDKDKDRKGKQASDELVLNDITGEVMAAILHYIYRGTFAYEPVHQLMDLMVAADHFLLDELVKSLTDTVIADLSPDKVVYVFKVASEHYNFDRLSKAATAYILEHGHLMLEEPSFLQSMTPDELVTFLSDDFFVVKEDNLIPFLFRYMKEHAIDQQENGLEVMSKLLDVVRFVLLADGPKLLATLDVNEELFFNLVVTKYDLAEERAAEIERRKLERKETEEKEAENISQSITNSSQ